MRADKGRSGKFYIAILTAAALTALMTGGYFFIQSRVDRENTYPPEKITFAYVPTINAVLTGVAQQQGYYLQEGLEVRPLVHAYGKPALEDLLAGKADFATVAEMPVMMAIMKGEKISIIATIQTSTKHDVIVARRDRGISTPGDLKGKTIASTFGTRSDFMVEAFLTAQGMAIQDVKKVDLKPGQLQEALENGQVDAVSVFQPYLIQIQKKFGERVISFHAEEIYTSIYNIAAKQEFVRNNPGKVKKLLRALVRAEEFVKQNPVEAQKIVADFSRMDIGLVGEIWPEMNFNVTLHQSLLLALEDESRWAISSGLIGRREIPNYLDFIYFEGLESVKPDAVRILR
jgi:ABC-type nitrate/sulfonate/bicarbonate transport system substrate-binding protein